MLYIILKLAVSLFLIIFISELSKTSSLLGGFFAALPIVSVLAIIWLWVDEKDTQKVIGLSESIIYLVIPSFSFFIALIILLKAKIHFWIALPISLLILGIFYALTFFILNKLGQNI